MHELPSHAQPLQSVLPLELLVPLEPPLLLVAWPEPSIALIAAVQSSVR